jgi:hypothetical protein
MYILIDATIIPMAMEPGVQALGAYNAGFYTSMTFVITEAVSSILTARPLTYMKPRSRIHTRVTLRGCCITRAT